MEVFGGFHHVGFYVNVFRTFIQWHAKKMVSKSIADLQYSCIMHFLGVGTLLGFST